MIIDYYCILMTYVYNSIEYIYSDVMHSSKEYVLNVQFAIFLHVHTFTCSTGNYVPRRYPIPIPILSVSQFICQYIGTILYHLVSAFCTAISNGFYGSINKSTVKLDFVYDNIRMCFKFYSLKILYVTGVIRHMRNAMLLYVEV